MTKIIPGNIACTDAVPPAELSTLSCRRTAVDIIEATLGPKTFSLRFLLKICMLFVREVNTFQYATVESR